MAFSDRLKTYISVLDVTPKDIAETARIAPSTFSRYLSGKRTPSADSDIIERLATAFATLSNDTFNAAEISSTLRLELTGSEVDAQTFTHQFSTLIDSLEINGNHLARSLGFDPSYISRVRSGQRIPGNIALFSDQVARYVTHNCTSEQQLKRIAQLTGTSLQDISNPEMCKQLVCAFLGSQTASSPKQEIDTEPLEKFLQALDGFDLPRFLEEVHFEDIRIPTVPFQLPTTKAYTGIEDMKQAELDFLKAAVLSKSTENVIFYSDMPLSDMAQDEDFPTQVMKGIALLVRKGILIQSIHDVYRPIEELFMGLEGWLPVYMTGQVESYYLPAPTNAAFLHFLRSAGTVAAAGEAIAGDQGSGRYIVTKQAADVAYYRTRATQLLALAKPLLKVFRAGEQQERDRALRKLANARGHDTIEVGKGAFETLSITALPGRYVLISKANPPATDILIEHPLLVDALERYEPTLFRL